MTIRSNTLTDGSIVMELDNVDDWQEFYTDNIDAIDDRYGSIDKAYRHLCDGGLLLGGGAAPEVAVYFAE
jgi:hypothetical protein